MGCIVLGKKGKLSSGLRHMFENQQENALKISL